MRPFYLKVDDEIYLRAPRPDDALTLYSLINTQRDYLGKWLVWVPRHTKMEHTLDFIHQANKFNVGGQKLTALIVKNEHIVGSLSLVRINKENKKAEIGYWINKSAQKQGVVSKSCTKLIEYAFHKLELNKLIIKVTHENTKSLAIAERLGFHKEGVLRQSVYLHNQFYDKIVYGLLKEEWMNKKL